MFEDGLFSLGMGLQIAGGIASLFGGAEQSGAYERSAAFQLDLGQQKSQWARELAQTDAELILERGENEAAIAEWNARQATDNAIFAARAGELDMAALDRKWTEQIKTVTAQFASSGLLLTDTPIQVLAEQHAEAAKDKYRLQLNTENAVARASGQADIFTLAGAQARASAQRQAEARLKAGDIDAQSSLLTAQFGAASAETQSDTAWLGGLTSLFGAGASAATSYLKYQGKLS